MPGNIRFALRTLRNNRGIFLFAIGVLALGIGIGTSIFSLVESVLLRPLPFREENSLVIIWKTSPATAVSLIELSYPELVDIQQSVPALESAALLPTTLYGYGKVLQADGSAPIQLETAPVSYEFFGTLGISPAIGRDFSSSDEKIGAAPVVILSNQVWREQFHAARTIVGTQITLSGAGSTVIGVMPPSVDFPRGVGLWLPLGVNTARANRQLTYLQVVARLRRGYSQAQLTNQLNEVFRRTAREHPETGSAGQQAVVTMLSLYLSGSSRLQLLICLAAAFLLLAAACVTAGNLLLSRALRRKSEIATRIALGAGFRQISAQFLMEGALAGATALGCGLVLASILIRVLVRWAPPEIPGIELARLDPLVFAFAAALGLLSTAACSLAPALTATGFGLEALLREGSGKLTAARSANRIQGVFTVAQTAITFVLLTISLLVVVSVRALLHTDTGFRNTDTITINLPLRGLRHEQRSTIYSRLLERLRQSPGITDAGGVLLRPLEGPIGWEMHYQVENGPDVPASEMPMTELEVITPGYLRTVGTPVLQGRDFGVQDLERSEPTVIVSRGLADRLQRAGHDPLRTRLRIGTGSTNVWHRIVGVVADTRDRDVTLSKPALYMDYLQTSIPLTYLAVRGHATDQELLAAVRRELAAIDSGQALANVATIAALIDRNTARARFNMALLFVFGGGALLLAAAGIYSVVAESVSVRRKEIAIRLAMGAQRPALIRHLIGLPLRCVLAGELVGLLAALVAGRLVQRMLYSITPGDPFVLGFVAAFLALTSIAAAVTPAWAASGEDPYPMLQAD